MGGGQSWGGRDILLYFKLVTGESGDLTNLAEKLRKNADRVINPQDQGDLANDKNEKIFCLSSAICSANGDTCLQRAVIDNRCTS